MPVTLSEKFVGDLCSNSFFNIWSFRNPVKEVGLEKELTDVLIVCDTNLIIISVKEIKFQENVAYETAYERWLKRAVERSVKQIYGAERQLKKMDIVINQDGEEGINLPPLESRVIHRIGVALGGKRKVLYSSANFGKGFVHIFDEFSFYLIIKELDTISDFIEYLRKKEIFLSSGKK
ncbi:MAG: hypothetical protein GF310_13530 [candidate division Zixibacteria bacterium]|nr:hypothetical protein [candidate division Zixibacteria bacterium]